MLEIIRQLSDLLDEYSQRLKNISDSEFSFKPSPTKWSKKEILGHIVDSAQNNILRFVRAQYEDKPHIVYNQDIWVAVQGYKAYPPKQLTELWQLLNKHICIILANMPAEVYDRLVNTGKEQERLFTLKFLAQDYVDHHLHHLKQIFNN